MLHFEIEWKKFLSFFYLLSLSANEKRIKWKIWNNFLSFQRRIESGLNGFRVQSQMNLNDGVWWWMVLVMFQGVWIIMVLVLVCVWCMCDESHHNHHNNSLSINRNYNDAAWKIMSFEIYKKVFVVSHRLTKNEIMSFTFCSMIESKSTAIHRPLFLTFLTFIAFCCGAKHLRTFAK